MAVYSSYPSTLLQQQQQQQFGCSRSTVQNTCLPSLVRLASMAVCSSSPTKLLLQQQQLGCSRSANQTYSYSSRAQQQQFRFGCSRSAIQTPSSSSSRAQQQLTFATFPVQQTSCRQRALCRPSVLPRNASAGALPEALLFDCDGVLVDTERDGHRISFNIAFSERGLDTLWDVDLYGELLKIGGGKERMTFHFNKVGWPEAAPKDEAERKEFVASLHKRKTDLFMDLVQKGSLPLRPGVARLVDQALDSGVNVAVCSTSNEKAVSAIVRVMLGPERASNIRIFAGDVVPRKKPDPAIYLLASTTLGVVPERSVVIEDSHIGLTAAKAAGMKCIVTKSGYTEDEDFTGADAVFESIGDLPNANFDLDFAARLLTSAAKSPA